MIRPGILALQGGFAAHEIILKNLGYPAVLVKTPEDLQATDCLIIPGGESTVMINLLKRVGLLEPLIERIDNGFPLFGTCAGMILLSSGTDKQEQTTLGAMNFTVQRNAYGRQKDSFETPLTWRDETFSALFIRAPRLVEKKSSVQILLSHEGIPVLIQEKNCLASGFHPELTGYRGIHEYFLKEIVKNCN
jgi:pyridoxal 5'-phosphate synthase pdxT subunit